LSAEFRNLTKDSALQRLMAWNLDKPGQIINPDIDGVLSALILHYEFGWPVIGFYDTKTISISDESYGDYFLDGKLNLEKIVWTDLDMSFPGARSIGQHVVNWDSPIEDDIQALHNSINPNLHEGWHRGGNVRYRDKYPFGTAQYLSYILSDKINELAKDNRLLEGLMWMPDGGAWSLGNFALNCRDWATNFMIDGALSHSALKDPKLVQGIVKATQLHLAAQIPSLSWSKTEQPILVLPSGKGYADGLDPSTIGGRTVLQKVFDESAELLQRESLVLPAGEFSKWHGEWRQLSSRPDSWHNAVNSGRVVSHALTTMRSFSVTLPTNSNNSERNIAELLAI